MVDQDAIADFQRSTRMPLDAVVRLHFEGTVAYQNGFAANVSASGMYVKHPDPPPVGTRLVFEFAIGAQHKPVQGAGEVVWSREKYDGPGRPAGAGIRFVELDPLSKQHLTEALFEFLEASLGDRVVESPEARALVASVPTAAPPEALTIEPEPEPEPAPAPAPEPEPVSAPPLLGSIDEAAGSPTPFRIFDEEPGPYVPEPLPPASAAIPEPADSGDDSHFAYGAAAVRGERSGRSGWLIGGGLAIVLAAAGAVWWFGFRTQPPASAPAAGPAAPPAASSQAAPAAPRPAGPPLDAHVAGDRTLVESVGGPVKVPETPLPPGGTAPAPAEEPAPATAPAPAPAPSASPAAAPVAASAPAGSPPARAVADISAAAAERSTVVTIAGDGAFAPGAFSYSEIGGDKPRVLIKLRGIAENFRAAPRGVPTAEVQGVRVGFHAEFRPSELHVVLDLTPGAHVAVESIQPVGEFLVVTLRRR